MQNATPPTPDVFRFTRPEGLSDDVWHDIVTRSTEQLDRQVAELLGRCPDHTWCTLAGHADHDEFHASDPIDLVASNDPKGETSAVAAWLVENRADGSNLRVVIDGNSELVGRAFEIDLHIREAAALHALLGRDDAQRGLERLLFVLAGGDTGNSRRLTLPELVIDNDETAAKALTPWCPNGAVWCVHHEVDPKVPGDDGYCWSRTIEVGEAKLAFSNGTHNGEIKLWGLGEFKDDAVPLAQAREVAAALTALLDEVDR